MKEIKEKIAKLNFNEIIELIELIYKRKEEINKAVIEGHITSKEYLQITSLLTPQSRSPLWEKAFIELNNAKKVPSSEGLGDFKINEKYYEYKITGINAGKILHIVQIRLWQNVGYIIQYIDKDFNKITFELSHNDMANEIERLNSTAAHGTKAANKRNKNIEYRLSILPDSDDFKRWTKSYSTSKYK